MKAILLRVGIDKGCGGALAPIFADGSFEYIPIPEEDELSKELRTFAHTRGRTGHVFSYYLPEKIKNKKIHFESELRRIEDELIQLREKISKIDSELDEKRKEITSQSEKIYAVQNIISVANERKNSLEKNHEK